MSKPFYIYKSLQRGLVPVARLSIEDSSVQVEASEVNIQRVLAGVFSRKAQVSVWRGDELIKYEPKTSEERAVTCLKRFLPRPYFASRDVPEAFSPRYHSTVEVNRAS